MKNVVKWFSPRPVKAGTGSGFPSVYARIGI